MHLGSQQLAFRLGKPARATGHARYTQSMTPTSKHTATHYLASAVSAGDASVSIDSFEADVLARERLWRIAFVAARSSMPLATSLADSRST